MINQPVYINCLAFQIGVAKRKISEYYERRLQPFGLSPTYVYVLGILRDHGPCTLTKIASILQSEKATVSTLLARMERDGFLTRQPGKERRTLSVILTEKGRDVLNDALQCLVQADMQLDEELSGSLQALKRLVFELNESI